MQYFGVVLSSEFPCNKAPLSDGKNTIIKTHGFIEFSCDREWVLKECGQAQPADPKNFFEDGKH